MPPSAPFRDRPVLEHIVEQHAEEAAFLWTLRDAAADAPHYKRHHLARLDERVEAHVDGLRVAGEAGWRIALEQLERRCEKGELFAAGVLALESGDMRLIEPLAARAEAEPEARRGFVGALAWCRPASLAPTVRHWEGSAVGFERYLAVCACSVHRADAGPGLGSRLEDPDALVRARALRLAGELGRDELLGACLGHIDGGGAGTAFWAGWSAVLLGDRGPGLGALAAAAEGDGPWKRRALEAAGRAMGLEHGARWARALNGDPRHRRLLGALLGHLGDPAALPWLIDRMARPESARSAGESVSMITGVDLAYEDLESRQAPGGALSGPTDDAGDEDAGQDPDEHLPWPDRALVQAWWDRNAARFSRGARHLRGRRVSDSACEQAWREGYQRQRRAAAHEAKLAGTTKRLLNWAERAPSAAARRRPG